MSRYPLRPKLYADWNVSTDERTRKLYIMEDAKYPDAPQMLLVGRMEQQVGGGWVATVRDRLFLSDSCEDSEVVFAGSYDDVLDLASNYVLGRYAMEGLS